VGELLLVAGFWAVTLYGSDLLIWAGPILGDRSHLGHVRIRAEETTLQDTL
jgi:hypothetical protein